MDNKTLILLGAGKYGQDAIMNINIDLYDNVLLCDNDKNKWGKEINGIQIISFDELQRIFDVEKMDLIITCSDYYGINGQLAKNNLVRNPESTKVWCNKRITDIESLNANPAYSQQGEDIFLRSFFADKFKEGGICVDIGAHDPFRFSNTYWGYKHGWKCINIEPNPEALEKFNLYRGNDININVGVSDIECDMQYYMFEEPAYNTFDVEFANIYMTRNKLVRRLDVPCKRLETILNEIGITDIDYFNIDVENYEMRVLNSNEWTKFRPKLILIEQFVNKVDEIAASEVCRFLREQHYECKNVIGDTVVYIRADLI